MKSGFLLSDNSCIKMDYFNVEGYCIDICLKEENILDFKKFSRNYKYFNAYFDFVTQKLGYLFLNPLMIENTILVFRDGAYYLVKNEGEQYEDFLKKETLVDGDTSFIVACSNKELKIGMATILDLKDAVIDPNRVRMMAYTGSYNGNGSHSTTCNTVFNQLLISTPLIVEHVESLLPIKNIQYAMLYLCKYLGFLHYDGKQKSILGNYSVLNNTLKSFVDDGKDFGEMEFIDICQNPDYNFSECYSEQIRFRR